MDTKLSEHPQGNHVQFNEYVEVGEELTSETLLMTDEYFEDKDAFDFWINDDAYVHHETITRCIYREQYQCLRHGR